MEGIQRFGQLQLIIWVNVIAEILKGVFFDLGKSNKQTLNTLLIRFKWLMTMRTFLS